MRPPVINTSVSPETRRKFEELCKWYGTGSEVLAVAIDQLWNRTFEIEEDGKAYLKKSIRAQYSKQ